MKQNSINGFTEHQIFQLYAYIVAYEDGGIQNYKSTKVLLEDHPELNEIIQTYNWVSYKKATLPEIKNADFKNFENKILMTKCKNNLLLSFLAHLRNSIAHGNAVEFNGKVLITNFANPRFCPTCITARGSIELPVFIKLTKILNKIKL